MTPSGRSVEKARSATAVCAGDSPGAGAGVTIRRCGMAVPAGEAGAAPVDGVGGTLDGVAAVRLLALGDFGTDIGRNGIQWRSAAPGSVDVLPVGSLHLFDELGAGVPLGQGSGAENGA